MSAGAASRLSCPRRAPCNVRRDTVDDEALRALANQRAQSVKSWLTDQGGVASKRMFLVASSSTPPA